MPKFFWITILIHYLTNTHVHMYVCTYAHFRSFWYKTSIFKFVGLYQECWMSWQSLFEQWTDCTAVSNKIIKYSMMKFAKFTFTVHFFLNDELLYTCICSSIHVISLNDGIWRKYIAIVRWDTASLTIGLSKPCNAV